MSATPPPRPPNVSSSDLHRHCHHRDDRCVALCRDVNFIVGNSNISLKGGGGEGEDLTTNISWESSSLPIVLPPHVLIPCYSAGDYVCCHKVDDVSSSPFPLMGVVSQTERLYPPLLSRIWRVGGVIYVFTAWMCLLVGIDVSYPPILCFGVYCFYR